MTYGIYIDATYTSIHWFTITMTMTPTEACEVLQIGAAAGPPPADEMARDALARQYRRRALALHPDKNPAPDAAARFCEAREAFEVLEEWYGYSVGETSPCDRAFIPKYTDVLRAFLDAAVENDAHRDVIMAILTRLATTCESGAAGLLGRLDRGFLARIAAFTQFLPKGVAEIVAEALKAAETGAESAAATAPVCEERHTLYATLDDLLECNVFKLDIRGQQFVIPLWATEELVYDLADGTELAVEVVRILPDGVAVDEDGNVTMEHVVTLGEVWAASGTTVEVGRSQVFISGEHIKCVPRQTVMMDGKGAPRFNDDNMFDVSNRGCLSVVIAMLLL
jgi:hypothetical protein